MVKDYGPMMRRFVLFCGLCADDMRYNKTVRLRLVTTRRDFSTQRAFSLVSPHQSGGLNVNLNVYWAPLLTPELPLCQAFPQKHQSGRKRAARNFQGKKKGEVRLNVTHNGEVLSIKWFNK